MNDLAEIKKNEKSKEQRFYKEQFITSKNYRGRRDLLNAILEDDREYTTEEVETMIAEYMNCLLYTSPSPRD